MTLMEMIEKVGNRKVRKRKGGRENERIPMKGKH
jgi:hypothetical protein